MYVGRSSTKPFAEKVMEDQAENNRLGFPHKQHTWSLSVSVLIPFTSRLIRSHSALRSPTPFLSCMTRPCIPRISVLSWSISSLPTTPPPGNQSSHFNSHTDLLRRSTYRSFTMKRSSKSTERTVSANETRALVSVEPHCITWSPYQQHLTDLQRQAALLHRVGGRVVHDNNKQWWQ